jgi:hypothetical protein
VREQRRGRGRRLVFASGRVGVVAVEVEVYIIDGVNGSEDIGVVSEVRRGERWGAVRLVVDVEVEAVR